MGAAWRWFSLDVSIPVEGRPEVISRFLEAAEQRDYAGVASCFTEDASVTDEQETHRGRAAISAWQVSTRSKWDYTLTVTGEQPSMGGCVLTAHLSGNFPGGEADVTYTFTLRDGLIDRLEID